MAALQWDRGVGKTIVRLGSHPLPPLPNMPLINPSLGHLGSITFRFSDFLKGHKELRKAVILRVMVYYRKRMPIKISNGKMCVKQRPGHTRHKLQVIFSKWSDVECQYYWN